jgi:thiol-disulfide isomerase/thioredoxin
MRWLPLWVCAVLAVGVAARAADDPPKEAPKDAGKSTPAEQFKALNAEYRKAMSEFGMEYRKAQTDEERQKTFAAKYPKPEAFVKRFLDFAKANPKEPQAFDALLWCVAQADETPEAAPAADILARDHAERKELGQILIRLAYSNAEWPADFLKKLAETGPTPAVRASATFGRGFYLKNRAGIPDQLRNIPEYQKAVAEQQGQAALQKLLALDSAKLTQEAEHEFNTLATKYPDEKYDRGDKSMTMRELAERFLFEIRNLGIGKPFPELESTDPDGHKVKVSDLKGKVAVLDVWATWCGPCRAMIPHERELVKKLEGRPFVLVSISTDAKAETLKKFVENEPMPWTHWWDGDDGQVMQKLNIMSWPTIYVLDAKGVIRFKGVRGEAMDKAVETLLREVEPAVRK